MKPTSIPSTQTDRRPDEEAQLERLRAVLRRFDRVVVAFSGGVDSALVAWAAHDVLGAQALAITGISPSLAEQDRARAAELAVQIGIPYREIETREMQSAAYRANAGDRCYHCKSELYDCLEAVRVEQGGEAILDGTNTDDFGDTRPGLTAAREHAVVSPLVEAELDKAAVRRLSRRVGLPTWDLPENACLASRIPVGTAVSTIRLRRVEVAEDNVRRLGFRQLRVRDDGDEGRVEIDPSELPAALEPSMIDRIEEVVRQAGFARARVDPAGYRRGGADRPRGEMEKNG